MYQNIVLFSLFCLSPTKERQNTNDEAAADNVDTQKSDHVAPQQTASTTPATSSKSREPGCCSTVIEVALTFVHMIVSDSLS